MMNNTEEKIIKILEENRDGLTINEIAKKIGSYRATVSKYLMMMEAQSIVYLRKIGPAKVYLLKDNVRDLVKKMEVKQTVKEKDWVDKLIHEIKGEVKEEIR